MMEATGFSRPIGAGARIIAADGHVARAEVVGFRGNRTLLMALDGDAAHAAGARVEPDASSSLAEVGPGSARPRRRRRSASRSTASARSPRPRPGRSPAAAATRSTAPASPSRSTPACAAINALLTAGVGQRIAIVAGSGVGKSVLMGQMMAGADADVIVVGLIGERSREVSDFLATKLPPEVRRKAVVVAVPADHAPLLRLRAAMRATAIAEDFRARGLKVLLLLDSLTRVAHAQREIGLSLGEPPTVKGYPPSALGLIPRLVERAGADSRTGGSITALYTVLADGDDTDDPIVDAARAIVDGHIILSRGLAEQGVFPAIDVGRSLSRVMADIVAPEHAAAAAGFRRLWSAFEENRDLILMGAYSPGTDPLIDEAIVRRPEILDFLKQAPNERGDFADSVAALTGMMAS